MAKFVFGRPAIMACGCDVNKKMGVNTWSAFAGTDDNAVVDGDFAATEDELQTVLRSLRTSGINIVAIHHHMTGETPRYLFLHYWATTIEGRRVSFKNTDQLVKLGVWHTIRVEFRGHRFTVSFDGKKVIEATDDSFRAAGRVGVWTKADSVTHFDDFRYGGK